VDSCASCSVSFIWYMHINLRGHNYFYSLCRGRDELSSVMNPGMQAKLDTTNILKVSLYYFVFPNRI
jgi:hypothetical protein